MDGVKRSPQAEAYHATIEVRDTGYVSADPLRILMKQIDRSLGADRLAQVMITADLFHYMEDPPQRMVREADAASLFRAAALLTPEDKKTRLFAGAGVNTARYLLRHRLRSSLPDYSWLLPKVLVSSVLSATLSHHAWYFIQIGHFHYRKRPLPELRLINNPLPSPKGVWHLAFFETLYRAVCGSGYKFEHESCEDQGQDVDVFRAIRDKRHLR